MMVSRMVAYRAELNERYWEYQENQYPEWEQFFDQERIPGPRPPVFRVDQAWRNVLFQPRADQKEIDSVLAWLPAGERHKWFRSMNSSQALAQSVLGNLAAHGQLECLAGLESDDGNALWGDAELLPDSFAMEFRVNYLGEPQSTSLDGYFGGDYRVAIECKFTELEVGTCSRPRLTKAASNYESDHCNGNYERQREREARCTLTEVGVQYWRYIPVLFRWNCDQDMTPCPLAPNYQLVRNILAAGVDPNGNVSSKRGHAVLIYDERNPAFQTGGAGHTAFSETKQALREPAMLRKCTWQHITEHMRSQRILPWLTEQLMLKYGL